MELSTILFTARSIAQDSEIKVLFNDDEPLHAPANVYFKTTLPTPVNCNVFPTSVPGPLTYVRVPPSGEAPTTTEDVEQKFPDALLVYETGCIVGVDSAPHT